MASAPKRILAAASLGREEATGEGEGMNNTDWLAALTGLAFLVLVIVGFVIAGEPPNPSDDPVQEIIDFYNDNTDSVWIGSLIQALAGTLLVFFGGYLRKVLRAAEGEGHMLSAVALVGATIIAIGGALDATINIALAEAVDNVDDLEPSAVQALSILWSNDFVPFAMGMQVFLLATGISVVRHGAMPKWLGWIAILFGVAAMTPVGFFAFFGAGLWVGAVSILLAMRARSASQAPPAPQAPPA
jgi:hypothetical protein